MKKSAFILLFLLASLPALVSRGAESRRGGRFRPSSDGKEFLDLGTALRLRGHGDVPTLRAGSFARPAQVERTVVAYDPRNAGTLLRTVLRIRAPRLVAVRRFLTAGRAPSAAVPQRRLSQIRHSGHLAIPFHFDDTTRPLPKRSFVCASTATCGSDSTRQAESCGAEPSRPEASLPQRRGCGLGRKHAPLRQIHFHIHKYRTEMNLSYIIGETLLMAGFTFIVGIAFAYALKLTTFFFSRLNGHDLPVLLRKSRHPGTRLPHERRPHLPIHPLDRPQRRPSKRPAATDACMIRTMQELAEYHFGNSGESSKEDGNMNGLYEFHHGKI